MPFSHLRAWQPAAARRWPTDEREKKEKKAGGTCYTCVTKPRTVRGTKTAGGSRTPEGRRKNAKTRGALKLLRKFLPRFRIPGAWTTRNAGKKFAG